MAVAVSSAVRSTLEEGRQAHIAVSSRGGPHVTPELYAWSGGQLWFATAFSTLKARVLERDRMAGAAVIVRDRAVILRGPVEIFDPWRVARTVGQLGRLPDAAGALVRYTIRNAPDLLAFVGDTATGKLGWRIPPRRVLVRLIPSSIALIHSGRVVEAGGGWGAIGSSSGEDQPGPPAGGEEAVVALPGPVVLPGRWFEEERRAYMVPEVLGLLGLPAEFPVGVAVDDYAAPGPAAKRGRLVRGTGFAGDGGRFVEVDPDRVVEWDGVETSTNAAS